jgi:hypothetical protein
MFVPYSSEVTTSVVEHSFEVLVRLKFRKIK